MNGNSTARRGQVLPLGWKEKRPGSDRQRRIWSGGRLGCAPPCVVGANACTPFGGLLRCEVQIGQRARVVVRVHGFVQRLVAPLVALAVLDAALPALAKVLGKQAASPAWAQVKRWRYSTTRDHGGLYYALPDGSSIRIDNVPATDTQGYAGLSDRIDRHTWQLLKGVVLSTLLGVGTELSFGSGESDLVRAIRESAQQSGARAGDQLVTRNLNIQPTLRVRPGWPLRVVLHKDIVLRPWRGGK